MLDLVTHAMGAAETVIQTMKGSTNPSRVMRGAPAKAAEINRFKEQGWAWEATAVFRIAPGGFNMGGRSDGGGGNRAAGGGGGARAKRKGRGKR